MGRLADTIARLAALRAQQGQGGAAAGVPSRLIALGNFGSNPGALKAHRHVPERTGRNAPLVVVLHGCTQTAAEYDHRSGWSRLADELGFALLYPEQQRANNANLCFNWFLEADTARGRGEAQSIVEMIDAMAAAHAIARDRVFVTGLSAGGAMAAALLASYPDRFAGGGIIAGLPSGSATTVPEAFERMGGQKAYSADDLQRHLRRASENTGTWPRISIWHGSADRTVAYANAEAIAEQWRGVHGLESPPTWKEDLESHARQVWCSADGEPLIELNTVHRMGHGTPLGADGLGSPGPYMLAAGVSSTRELARFWGLAPSGGAATMPAGPPMAVARDLVSPPRPAFPPGAPADAANGRDDGPRQRPFATTDVKKIIEDALRAAKLMR